MESDRFDAFTRTLSSRRTALGGGLGGVAALLGLGGGEEAAAHDPRPACRKLADPARRRACLRRARRHLRLRHSCKPHPIAVTCANRCGSTRNNCKKAVACICPPDKTCLLNNGCARTCSVASLTCPAGCTCGIPLAEAPGTLAGCYPSTLSSCTQVPTPCTSTAQCPFGQFCGLVCGSVPGEGRCFPNCPV